MARTEARTESAPGFFENLREKSIRREVNSLEDCYGFCTKFDLVEPQSALFEAYMIGYLTSKLIYEDLTSLLNRPLIEMSRNPLVSYVVGLARKTEEMDMRISERYFKRAEEISDLIKEVAANEAYKAIAEKLDMDVEEAQKVISKDLPIFKEYLSSLLAQIGSPASIKRAANLISSTYVLNRTKSKEEQRRVMANALARIRVKDEPRTLE